MWYECVLREWKPRSNLIILIPCARRKPYHKSVTHRYFFKKVWELWKKDMCDLVILSEPLTVVPAEYDYPCPKYPLYDYPPAIIKKKNHFSKSEVAIWRSRLRRFLSIHNQHACYFILYKYHRKLLGDILESHCMGGIYTERPYISKAVELSLEMIKNKEKEFCVMSGVNVCIGKMNLKKEILKPLEEGFVG